LYLQAIGGKGARRCNFQTDNFIFQQDLHPLALLVRPCLPISFLMRLRSKTSLNRSRFKLR
jgi:hypothetical protein